MTTAVPDAWTGVAIPMTRAPNGRRVAVSLHNVYADQYDDPDLNLVQTLRWIQQARRAGSDLMELDFYDDGKTLRIGHMEATDGRGASLADALRAAAVRGASQPIFLECKEETIAADLGQRLLAIVAKNAADLANAKRPFFVRAFRSRRAVLQQVQRALESPEFASFAPHIRLSLLVPHDEVGERASWPKLMAEARDLGVHMVEISHRIPAWPDLARIVRGQGKAVGVWTFAGGAAPGLAAHARSLVDQVTTEHHPAAVKRALAGGASAPPAKPASKTPLKKPQAASAKPKLLRTIEVAGRQGVACLADGYVISGNKLLVRVDTDGKEMARNEAPLAGWNPTANHFGDIDVHDGTVYASAERFEGGAGHAMRIGLFDVKTLAFQRALDVDPKSGQVELCGIAVDAARGWFWLADWTDGSALYKYDLRTGAYVGKLRIQPAMAKLQGLVVDRGAILLTADDGDEHNGAPDHVYRIAEPTAAVARVEQVMTFDYPKRAGEIEGLCVRPSGELVVHSNRGRRVVNGMPKGFYPGYSREIREIFILQR